MPIMKKRLKNGPHAQTFRAGVGAVILNGNRKVLALERKDVPGAWQLPQGGLNEDETPLEAVRREVQEETGIEPNQVELLTTLSRLLAYELPAEFRSRRTGRGQVHYWFLFRFTGQDNAITLGDKKEFRGWQWMSMKELVDKIVAFKQPVYQELASEFGPYLD